MPAIEILAAEAPEAVERPADPVTEPSNKIRRFHALTFTDHLRLLLPFFFMGLVGGVARFRYFYWWPAFDLVMFVANVFIATAVLGIVLELFYAKLLVEKVSDGLAQRMIGRGLPVELQAQIRDIVATDFVRDRYVKSYTFSDPEDGQLNVDIEVRYELRNYSEAVREYAPELAAETFFNPQFRFLEYGIVGRKIHTFSDENLLSKVETVEELNLRRLPRSALPAVSLKPVRSGEKSVCQVTWRYRVTVPEQYCDITDFGEATLGATLQVQNIPEELEFVSGGDPSLHHEANSQSWYFDRSFLPGQHLRAWWYRKVRSTRHLLPSRHAGVRTGA